jgi:hypothetical protein
MEVFVAFALLIGILVLLLRQLKTARQRRHDLPQQRFASLRSLIDDATVQPTTTYGTELLTGTYRGHAVQIKTITDTLSTRKLPSLWLMVTIPEPTGCPAIFNLMMRPAGPTTFSNFDDLPHTIKTPLGFPPEAVLRTDSEVDAPPLAAIQGALAPFFKPEGKELLITPRGVRITSLAAQADRARYGVFRQADFGDVALDANFVKDVLEILISLRAELLKSNP